MTWWRRLIGREQKPGMREQTTSGRSHPPSDSSRSSQETSGQFLEVLSDEGRVAVSNLNPLIYQTLLLEKQGKDAPALFSTSATDYDLVRQLPESDIEVLCRSVEAGQQGDRAAGDGDLDSAAGHYRTAFELNPHNDLAFMSYGVCLAQQGQLQEGIKWVQKAVDTNPANERARNNLAAMQADL